VTATCLVIAVMALLVAVTYIPQMPTCPFCGKTREHAYDCPTQRGK
jgi:hypothetical protein